MSKGNHTWLESTSSPPTHPSSHIVTTLASSCVRGEGPSPLQRLVLGSGREGERALSLSGISSHTHDWNRSPLSQPRNISSSRLGREVRAPPDLVEGPRPTLPRPLILSPQASAGGGRGDELPYAPGAGRQLGGRGWVLSQASRGRGSMAAQKRGSCGSGRPTCQ